MAADVTDCWHELAKWFEFGTNNNELCNTFRMVAEKRKKRENKYHSHKDLTNFLYNYSEELLEITGYSIRYHKKNGIGTFEIHRQLSRDPITNEPFPESQDFNPSEKEKNVKVEEYGFDQVFQDVLTKDEKISLSDENHVSINLPWTNSDHLLPSSYSYSSNISTEPFDATCRLVPNDPNKVQTINIPYSYAHFGHDMVVGDFNGDGIQDLAISAPFYSNLPEIPQVGAIFIINGRKSGSFKFSPKSSNILDLADKIIYAYNSRDGNNNEAQSRFGWSMSVVDLNKDGIDDLAVSAPSFGANKYIYSGKVYVYFGKKNEGLKADMADLEINSKRNVSEYDWQIEAFGQYMSAGDVDGDGFADLLIGCPYCGMYSEEKEKILLHTGGVFAFLSSSDHKGNITVYDYDWSIISPGDHEYEWFGYSINYYKSDSMQNPIIIVGAPGYHEHSITPMVGRIYGFEIIDKVDQNGKGPVKIFDLCGVEEFQGFGSSIIVGDLLDNGESYILVASNSETHRKKFPQYGNFWQAGAIRLINMQYLKEDKKLSDEDMSLGRELLALLRGSESASRLGSSLLWDSNEKSLWASEPFTYWESGQIFKYSIGSSLVSEVCLVGRERQARFGNKMIKFDFNGDGKNDLVVNSEHSSYEIGRAHV